MKKYKLHVITASLAIVAVFFAAGITLIAKNGVANVFDRVYAAPASGGPDCTQAKAVQDLKDWNISYSGSVATASIKNTSDHCTYQVIFASYSAIVDTTPDFQKFIDTQKLFDEDVKQVGPGQTATYRVDLDKCTVWQVDLFYGPDSPVPPDFDNITGYHNFDSRIDGRLNSCQEPPTTTNKIVTGYHDSNNNALCIANGWAADPDDKSRDVTVKVYANGNLAKTLTANAYRADLESAGVCTGGTCAWGDGFSDVLEAGKTYSIRATAIDLQTGEEVELKNTPKSLTCGTVPPPPTECTIADAKNDLNVSSISVSGGKATAHATNNSTRCTHRVGLASYEAYMNPNSDFQRFIDTQTLFDSQLKNLAPGQSASFEVDVPTCTIWQVDFFATKAGLNAPVPPDFAKLPDYNNFDAKIGGQLNSCPQPTNLNVVCDVANSNARRGENVTFTASPTGGNGSYTYNWTGDVTGTTQSITKKFYSLGTKYGTVTVTSGNQTRSATCSAEVVPDTDNLTGSCQALPSSVKVGETVNWSATASEGTGSYTYQWSGAVTGNGANKTATYNTPGTKTATVSITSGGELITRNCSVNVTSAPVDTLAGSCQGVPSNVKVGESVNWLATASGGTGSYVYSWSGDVTGSGANRTTTYNTPGTKTATVVITSGSQNITRNCSINVMDFPALIGSCQGVPSTVRVGETVNWSASATGGNGTYAYIWSGAVSGYGVSKTTTYNTPGTKTATIVINSGSQSVTRTCSINVVQDNDLAGSCQGVPSTVNVGQPVNWSASATGGTGSYTYQWSGAVSGTGKNRTATYNTPGTKTATVVITSGSQNITRNCSVNVAPINLSVACTASTSTVQVGQPVTFTASATGGNGTVNFSWSGTENLSGNGQTITKTFDGTGTATATVTASSGGVSATASCTVTITEAPVTLTGSCVASPSSARRGQTVTWTANPSGGNGNYTYSWSGDVSGTSKSVSRSYDSTGTKNATVVITSGSESITRNCSVSVQDQPLNVSCEVRSSSYEVGDTVRWTADASGGDGNYEYDWDGSDNLNGSSRSVSKTYRTDGRKTARVTVTSGGQQETATCQVRIDDEPRDEDTLDVNCSATPGTVGIGESVRWRADADGGRGGYRYYWSGSDNLSSNDESLTKSYSSTGYKNATVVVSSGGQTVSATCNVLVTAPNLVNLPLPPSNPLSYVYLNQVPYTGIMDDMGKVLNLFLVVVWSAGIAYIALKFWNKRRELAFAGDINPSDAGSGVGKFKNILASILPGSFASPYIEEEVPSDVEEEEEKEEEDELEEGEIDEEEASSADISALANLAASKKALVSTAALKSLYNDHDGNFEDASLELLQTIDSAALSYPREDGWLVLTSERLSALK